ncbi:hypothetical protein ACI798_09405 [Geodermatophilus sp. SYSU D01045]
MTASPAQQPLDHRRAAVSRGAVAAIRAAAAAAAEAALTYDDVACAAEAACSADPSGPHRDRAARMRRRAEEERCEALRMWTRADALESAAH